MNKNKPDAFKELLRRQDIQRGLMALNSNEFVTDAFDNLITGFEKQALTIEGLDNDQRFQALVAANAIKQIKSALSRAETRIQNIENMIEKKQTSKESI